MNTRPNIVIIMTDQQRADHRLSEGFALDTMPTLDRLGRGGVDFAKAYTTAPACMPARVSLFTGRYPTATHVRTNHNAQDAYFDTDLLQVLKSEGYATALCGKNHAYFKREDFDFWRHFSHGGGEGPNRSKQEEDFDKYLTELKHLTDPRPTPFPLECQGPYRAVSSAQDWIRGIPEDNPFFLWLSFAEPHNPYQVPEPYFDMFPPDSLPPTRSNSTVIAKKGFKYRWIRSMWEKVIPDFDDSIPRTRSNYCGMLRLIDDQINRFVTFLEDEKLVENSIIVLLSDHGDFVGEYGLIRKGPELPEVLVRIPLIIFGPGIRVRGKNLDDHVSIVDIMPTLCDAIGVQVPKGVQGRSLWPILTGGSEAENKFSSAYIEHGFGGRYYDATDTLDPREEGAVSDVSTFDELNSWTQAGAARAVRKSRWKLIYDMEGNGQLYDLHEDPVELNNLYDDPAVADVRSDLMGELLKWVIKTQDPLPYPRARYRFKRCM